MLKSEEIFVGSYLYSVRHNRIVIVTQVIGRIGIIIQGSLTVYPLDNFKGLSLFDHLDILTHTEAGFKLIKHTWNDGSVSEIWKRPDSNLFLQRAPECFSVCNIGSANYMNFMGTAKYFHTLQNWWLLYMRKELL